MISIRGELVSQEWPNSVCFRSRYLDYVYVQFICFFDLTILNVYCINLHNIVCIYIYIYTVYIYYMIIYGIS